MAAMSAVSWMPLVSTRIQTPKASLSLLTGSGYGSTRNASSSVNTQSSRSRSALLHCSFTSSSSSSFAFASYLSGLSLDLGLGSKVGSGSGKRRGLVVRAGKAALCLTKRNRSRKSLARTHGFRRRMRTTSGRALIKRRRAKGRKILCTKSYPRTGPGS